MQKWYKSCSCVVPLCRLASDCGEQPHEREQGSAQDQTGTGFGSHAGHRAYRSSVGYIRIPARLPTSGTIAALTVHESQVCSTLAVPDSRHTHLYIKLMKIILGLCFPWHITAFCYLAPFSVVEIYRRFRGTCNIYITLSDIYLHRNWEIFIDVILLTSQHVVKCLIELYIRYATGCTPQG
jgi:hypothetical protein